MSDKGMAIICDNLCCKLIGCVCGARKQSLQSIAWHNGLTLPGETKALVQCWVNKKLSPVFIISMPYNLSLQSLTCTIILMNISSFLRYLPLKNEEWETKFAKPVEIFISFTGLLKLLLLGSGRKLSDR